LRQILVNLLSNAVKFTEKGEVVLSISSEREAAAAEDNNGEKYLVNFTVKDTGIGIPSERMDRLFQSFSQVDASTTRRYGGTGLGLVISKRLSEMMGGTMWVTSEVGVGSTFHFTIRAYAAPALERAFLKGIQPTLQGKRALIVDDNATNRTIVSRYLDMWQMYSEATASPLEALGGSVRVANLTLPFSICKCRSWMVLPWRRKSIDSPDRMPVCRWFCSPPWEIAKPKMRCRNSPVT
jgi:hypothetical protein